MAEEKRKIKWLDVYRRIRKPTAPPPKAHGAKGYSKADRRQAKKRIQKEQNEE